MKVVIVAKTRMGAGACIGGLTFSGQSVRLLAADAESNARFNQEYEVGDVWDVMYETPSSLAPPHVENIVVYDKRKLPPIDDLAAFVEQKTEPVYGGVNLLYGGMLQATKAGVQYIAERTGIPDFSTMFWRPDKPLQRCASAKRIRYVYPSSSGERSLTFVGFQEPLEQIPAGTILRVSLAHWWRPREMPDGELRCYVQLSGWYLDPGIGFVPEYDSSHALLPHRHDDFARGDAQKALKQVFGHESFRPQQAEIVDNVLQKQDSLVVMPTGSGKSLCYQLPALLFPGLTVVVSPLISLMQDQVEQLRQHGIAAEFLNSTLAYSAQVRIMGQVRAGKVKLLYAAPETLLKPETLLLLQNADVDCLTIDEAHCISQWGHDFRPEYRELISLRSRLPAAVCLAVTATATERVRRDIKDTLHIRDADEFIASFDRNNLFLAAEQKQGSLSQILDFLQDHEHEAGIIYCNTKKEVNELVERVVAKGIPALPYHADLDNDTRRDNQRRFIHEEGLVVVATIAFGMGINKSNVRFVIHYGLPKNLENYYQQIGRAGRDGLRADCLLLYSQQDVRTIQYFTNQQHESQQEGARRRMWAMLEFAETAHCRRPPLLAYFGETAAAGSCGMCDNCLRSDQVEEEDITIPAQKFLSCVKRTEEIFGAAHIIDVLRGSRAQKVLKWRHEALSTHGAGREFSKRQWQDLVEQFMRQDLLQKDMKHGSLKITERGKEVLEGAVVKGSLPQEEPVKQSSKRAALPAHDAQLFELLRTKRTELARQANVPPYVIFSDRSLSEMAAKLPQTEQAFAAINGVGEHKLRTYAHEFLPIISAYCQEKNVANSAQRPVEQRRSHLFESARTMAIAKAFDSGKSLEFIASDFNIKRGNVINHLWRHVRAGGCLEAALLLDASTVDLGQRQEIFEAINALGTERLGPIYALLDESVSYDELRLLVMFFLLESR